MARVLVTGANRGIGLEVCRQLSLRSFDVLLAARDERAGQEAARSLGQSNVRAVQLDVTDADSVGRLASMLRDAEWTLDALVNNAAVMHRGINETIARDTLEVNYRGAVRVTDALLSSLNPGANIVMVSSGMGELAGFGQALRQRLTNPELRREDLDALRAECLLGVAEGTLAARGFPQNVYSVSKALLNGFTRVLSRELLGSSRRVNAVCPGWVQTRMGGASAPRTAEAGASGIVWASTLDVDGPKGGFFRDGNLIDW